MPEPSGRPDYDRIRALEIELGIGAPAETPKRPACSCARPRAVRVMVEQHTQPVSALCSACGGTITEDGDRDG